MSKKIKTKNIQTYYNLKKKQIGFLSLQNKKGKDFFDYTGRVITNPESKLIMGRRRLKTADICGPCCFRFLEDDNLYIKNDLINAYKYVKSKYPGLNFSKIVALSVPWKLMSDYADLDKCGGCYIPARKAIFIKKGRPPKECQNKLFQNFAKYSIDCSDDDIFVHELFHAASHLMQRSTRKFIHMEEEFVYTNTIDWFRDKGFSKEDIVNKNFLPFAMQDVLKEGVNDIIIKIAKDKNISVSQEQLSDCKFKENFAETHIKQFMKSVINRSREKALTIIRLFDEKQKQINSYVTKKKCRFAMLDFD